MINQIKSKISVAIAVYNEEKFIEEAIVSIVSQGEVLKEIIIVDDNSTDATCEKIEKLASDFPVIRLYKNPKNGKVAAFNHAVSHATGEWLCLFAGDDIMPYDSLLERYNSIKHIDETKVAVGLSRLKTMSEYKKYDGHVVPKNDKKGGFTGTSYLMSRGAVDQFFPIPEVLPNEDTWLEVCMLHYNVDLVHAGVISNYWRVHQNNSINTNVPFELFEKKYASRMKAFELFLDINFTKISEKSKQILQKKVKCEQARQKKDLFGVIMSGAPVMHTLRNLAYTNSKMYYLREKLYGLLSGLG